MALLITLCTSANKMTIVSVNGVDEYMDLRGEIKKFNDFFDDTIEYPSKQLVDSPLPMNTMYSYVASTFLNGFINYITILQSFVISRYNKWDDVDGWSDDSETQNQIFERLLKNPPIHPTLSDFGDDVLILGVSESGNTYMFFWYDMDCSDSCIGRFTSDLPTYKVIELFAEYVKELDCNRDGEKEIPLSYFSGWIKG